MAAERMQTKEVRAPMSFWDRLEEKRPHDEPANEYLGRILMEAYDAQRTRK